MYENIASILKSRVAMQATGCKALEIVNVLAEGASVVYVYVWCFAICERDLAVGLNGNYFDYRSGYELIGLMFLSESSTIYWSMLSFKDASALKFIFYII